MLIVSKTPQQTVVNLELRLALQRKKLNNRSISKTEPRKRNRAIVVLLLPLIVIIWIFGSSLYWLGPKKAPTQQKQTVETGNLTYYVSTPEEKIVTHQTN